MKTIQQTKGLVGEDYATEYLLEQGYRIRDRNWRCGHLEVDIIAEDENYIIFVEVKTRKNVYAGAPEDFVNKQKQRNIIRAARYYMRYKNLQKEVRFDIISVVFGMTGNSLKHIQDAYKPTW